MSRTCLVLFAHGSRDPRWRAPFEKIVSGLQHDLGERCVRLAFMEFCDPTMMTVAGEAAAEGFTSIRVLPLFLAGGAHVANDIPRIVLEVRQAWPALEVEVLPPVGEDPRFAALLADIARENAGGPPSR